MPIEIERLIDAATSARERAYAPYSEYRVGAAVLTGNGTIHSGCNVENASYGLTICAERNAICSAVASGDQQFEVIVICTEDGGSPCGACRQVIGEFGNVRVLTIDGRGQVVLDTSLEQLLPDAFRRG
jgi:cytidine deaminase